MLKITNLSKSYAKSPVNAVDQLNLELNAGEIFGFLGPNGAGKTTTIKLVTGILSFNQGQVTINGIDIKQEPIRAKMNVGYVSDSHIIHDKLTGREYVDFLADVYDVPKSVRQERAKKMLEIFSLTHAFDSPINTYSHGMKQKISIIGALIHNPKLWILDEPLVGLDPQSAFELKKLMREHCKNGNTVFFSTHILEVAEKLCDRIGIIVKGKLIKCGNLEEIKKAQSDKSLEEIFLSVAGKDEINGEINGEIKIDTKGDANKETKDNTNIDTKNNTNIDTKNNTNKETKNNTNKEIKGDTKEGINA